MAEPWLLAPSRGWMLPAPTVEEPVPIRVETTLAQRLFIDKTGLPSPVLDALKRLAAFRNPEFYRKQAMRLSTALTPRIIACAEDFPRHVSLPRGCADDAATLLRALGSMLDIDDQRETGQAIHREVRIYDYVDRCVPVLARMYERRLAGYRSIGYDLSDETVL